MLAKLKMNLPLEGIIEIPKPGTVTPVSGSGAFVATIDMLRDFDANGVEPGQLAAIIDALEEQEHLYAMVTLSSAKTGIDNMVYMIPVPHGSHGPRLKVMIDPPHAKHPGGKEATVPFDNGTVPPVDARLERQLRDFIKLNEPVLLAYWRLELTTDEFVAQLRSI
jgi:hypothetical protein